jgi:hypothetical protein
MEEETTVTGVVPKKKRAFYGKEKAIDPVPAEGTPDWEIFKPPKRTWRRGVKKEKTETMTSLEKRILDLLYAAYKLGQGSVKLTIEE